MNDDGDHDDDGIDEYIVQYDKNDGDDDDDYSDSNDDHIDTYKHNN